MFTFIKNLYKNYRQHQSLIDIVPKQYHLEEGIFANINNDIAFIDYNTYSNLIFMTYAYTRRTVAGGLYLQGIFSDEDYQRASIMFKSIQIKTFYYDQQDPTNVKFQEQALAESIDFLLSYDKRLTKKIVIAITRLVELNPHREQFEKIQNYDKLIDYLQTFN